MPNEEAAVGIKFYPTGIEETLLQIGRLNEALGALGMIPSNPFNPGLTRQPAERGAGLSDVAASSPMSGGAGGSPFYPAPSQQGPAGASAFQIQQATIQIQTATITVQTGTVNFTGAAAGAGSGGAVVPGGAPVAAPGSSSNVAPPGPPLPAPTVAPPPTAQAGAYASTQAFHMAMGASEAQANALVASGASRNLNDFILPGGPVGQGPGFGQAFAQRMLGGIPGVGEMLSGGGGALAGAAAAAYAAHLATQMGNAALAPAMSMTGVSSEAYAASVLAPLGGIPVLGMPFQMGAERLRALDTIRNQAGMSALGSLRGITPGQIEATATQSGSGNPFLDTLLRGGVEAAAGAIPGLGPILSPALGQLVAPGGGPQGIPGMGGQQVSQGYAALLGANPMLTDDQVRAILTRAAQASDRPEVQMGAVSAAANLESLRLGTASLAGGALSRTANAGDVRTLAGIAAMRGDVGGIARIQAGARANNLNVDVSGLAGPAAQLGLLGLEAGTLAGATQQVTGEEARAQATLRGGAAVGAVIRQEPAALDRQIANVDAQIATISSLPESPERQQQLAQLRGQRQGLEISRASAPYRAEASTFGAAMGTAQAASSLGGTMLGSVQAFGVLPGARMDAAFSQVRSGLDQQIEAQQAHVAFLTSQNAGPEQIAQAQSQLAALRQQRAQEPLTEIGMRQGAMAGLGGAISAQGQAGLGVTMSTQFSGEDTARLQEQIRSGLRVQMDAATQALGELSRTPGVDRGLIEQKKAEIAGIQAAIAQSMIEQARGAAQDAFQVAGHAGRMVSPGIAAAGALGVAPTAGQQGAQAASLQRELTTAEANAQAARGRGDEREAMRWDEQAAQLRGQIQVLPITQIEQRLAPAIQTAAAQQAGAGAGVAAARLGGAGSAQTFGTEMAGVGAAENNLKAQEQKLRELQATAPAGSALVAQQQAAVEQARLGVAQARTGLGDVALPTSMREGLAQSDYEIQVLKSVPGASGNYRGALMRQMGGLQAEGAYLTNELQTRGSQMTEEGRFNLMNQIRGVGLRQAQGFEELSEGWQDRLISTVIGHPGNMNLDARFSMRDAVLGGISNPHMGARAGQMPFFMQQAGLSSMPAVMMGTRGGYNMDTGKPFSEGARVFGQPALPGMPGYGGSGTDIHVDVTIRDPSGNVLGHASRGGVEGGQSATAHGTQNGGMEDMLTMMGFTVARNT